MSQKLILLFGPMAVGKMTVGKQLSDKLGYPLFHNHQSIEFALTYYNYDTAGFTQINEGIRSLMFETMSQDTEISGFIFTFVWAFEEADDWKYIERITAQFSSKGWDVYYVELNAQLEVRLERNRGIDRILHKPSKKNLEASEQSMLQLESRWRLESHPGEITFGHYIKIDNTFLTKEECAFKIIKAFALTP